VNGTIAIIDYGRGNLKSVSNAFAFLGVRAVVTSDRETVRAARSLVLPGVGEFSDAMEALASSGLDGEIRSAIRAGKPFLGICLGYQMLFERSEEGGNRLPGLGLLRGDVRRFTPRTGLKIPHTGWNAIRMTPGSALFAGIADETPMYFVHAYYPVPAERTIVSAVTDHGGEFAAAISSGNLHGVQFHPEKSGNAGLRMLKNFAEMKGTGGC
jgi:glutamine amidotransferase